MTPKEKAIELFDKFDSILFKEYDNLETKKCALIAVDEIIGQWEIIDVYLANGNGQLNQNLDYWYKVQQEIELL